MRIVKIALVYKCIISNAWLLAS